MECEWRVCVSFTDALVIIFLYPYVIHIASVDGYTVYNLIVYFTFQMGVKFGSQALLFSFLAGGAILTRLIVTAVLRQYYIVPIALCFMGHIVCSGSRCRMTV